jgi:hypothetical protein
MLNVGELAALREFAKGGHAVLVDQFAGTGNA